MVIHPLSRYPHCPQAVVVAATSLVAVSEALALSVTLSVAVALTLSVAVALALTPSVTLALATAVVVSSLLVTVRTKVVLTTVKKGDSVNRVFTILVMVKVDTGGGGGSCPAGADEAAASWGTGIAKAIPKTATAMATRVAHLKSMVSER